MKGPIGVYIHVPFCPGKCPYCDFYSLTANRALMEEFTASVARRAEQCKDELCRGIDTLYFGGGTPSILGGEHLKTMIKPLIPYLAKNAEITVECNPAGQLEALLPQIAEAGVNRISLGMQSAVDAERKALGRKAGRERVAEALAICKASGISNISLDLMLGIPGMTMESLEKSIDFILSAEVPHVSAYLLKIEPDTPFSERQDLFLPEEDLVCEQYLHTVRRLEEAGLKQYEISNFALPGYESRHNLKYWHCEEYLGIGPAAHSYLNGKRFYYPRDLSAFLNGAKPIADGSGGSREEQIMLALRLTEGVDSGLLTPEAKKKTIFYMDKGLMQKQGSRYALTPQGFLLSNTIISDMLSSI